MTDKTSSRLLLHKIALKTVQKKMAMFESGKGSKIIKEKKPLRNINKNPQSYRIRNMQKEVLLSRKL